MDYPDLAVGTNFLYMSVDNVGGGGLLVVRIPLTEIRDSQTIHFNYSNPSDAQVAYGSHLSQNASNEIFWGGHLDTSTMQVFSWTEGSSNYSWRSVATNSWPNCDHTSLGSDGKSNWLFHHFPGGGPIGNTVVPGSDSPDEVWFSWMAGRAPTDPSDPSGKTCGADTFPQPHIQIARIETSTFALVNQMQVWSSDFAFAYPALMTNSLGQVGMSVLWGGNSKFDTTYAVGIWGDFMVWNTGAGQGSFGRRNGDYLGVRRASNPELFAGFGYNVVNDTPPASGLRADSRYVLFGRRSIVLP